MIKGPLEADARIAAKNAVKIRAALGLVTDWKRTFERYQETHPIATNNKAKDRARARAWILLNVGFNNDALASAVHKSWADAWVLGSTAANEWISKTKGNQRSQKVTKSNQADINWSTWKPGDRSTALMLKPIGGYQKFLEQQGAGSYFKKFDRETIENLGTAMANSIEAGLGAEEAALMIKNYVANASRALTIAITEQNRAMSAASMQSYRENDIEKVQWETSSPCDICADNQGVVIALGDIFPSGDDMPPAHPHCRCVLLPVVPGMDEGDPIEGANLVDIPDGSAHLGDTPEPMATPNVAETTRENVFRPGNWRELTPEEAQQRVIDRYNRIYPTAPNLARDLAERDNSTKLLIENGKTLANGPVEVRVYGKGMEVPEANIKEIVDHLEKLQISNPKSEDVILTIGASKEGAYGWAIVDGRDIWIAPKTAKMDAPNTNEGGSFKMPALSTNKQYLYTLTHEWGHHIDIDDRARSTRIGVLKRKYKDEFKSGYSRKNRYEFYAEMFAEYYLSGGQSENALVQAMAKEFGWKA